MNTSEVYIRDNFIEVCDRLELTYEAAIDWQFCEADFGEDELRDLAFGLGYVRGLADAWGMTSLEVLAEVVTEDEAYRLYEETGDERLRTVL